MNGWYEGARVIQVFPRWPARFGTVLEVDSLAEPSAMRIGWDDGREDRVQEEDVVSLGIWFIVDEGRSREPKPGPLETQLARFMATEKTSSG